MDFAYTDWFVNVFHWIHTWDGSNNATQVTTTEWIAWANAQSLPLGEGSWGNSAHGWGSSVIYPAGVKVDGSVAGESYASLQNGNVGHQPETSPTWWELIAAPDIGADSALFTATSGTTKLAGWDQRQTNKLSGHLFSQAAGVNSLVYSQVFDRWGHFVGKSAGPGECAVRMSLTEDTCYTFTSEEDGEGGYYLYFYKVVSGTRILVHTGWTGTAIGNTYDLRFYVAGDTLGVDYITSPRRTLSANITADPIKWQASYTTLTEWTDPDPIPLLGHEHVGYRIQEGSPLVQVTHEGFGGAFEAAVPLPGRLRSGTVQLADVGSFEDIPVYSAGDSAYRLTTTGTGTGAVELLVDDVSVGTASSPGSISIPFSLSAGVHTLRLQQPSAPVGESRPAYNTGTGFFVKNGKLYDANGIEFKKRGTHFAHPPDDHGWSGLVRAKFNAIRFHAPLWEGSGTPVATGFTATVMQDIIDHGMVPQPCVFSLYDWNDDSSIAGLWTTGGPHGNGLTEIRRATDLWVAKASMMKTYEPYAILEIANEWGDSYIYNTTWLDGFKESIQRIRGIHPTMSNMNPPWLGPIQISGDSWQDTAQDVDNLLDATDGNGRWDQQLWNADPQKNLIFSTHIYNAWYDSVGGVNKTEQWWPVNDLVPLFDDIRARADSVGYAFTVDEFGPGEGRTLLVSGGAANGILPALNVIRRCQEYGFGWVQWCWDDGFASSPSTWASGGGGFNLMWYPASYNSDSDLTPFGQVVIKDATYGSQATGVPATVFGP